MLTGFVYICHEPHLETHCIRFPVARKVQGALISICDTTGSESGLQLDTSPSINLSAARHRPASSVIVESRGDVVLRLSLLSIICEQSGLWESGAARPVVRCSPFECGDATHPSLYIAVQTALRLARLALNSGAESCSVIIVPSAPHLAPTITIRKRRVFLRSHCIQAARHVSELFTLSFHDFRDKCVF